MLSSNQIVNTDYTTLLRRRTEKHIELAPQVMKKRARADRIERLKQIASNLKAR